MEERELQLLGGINKNTARLAESKPTISLIVSDTKTRIRTEYNPSISLDHKKKYEMALVNLETYYSFPNVTSSNNKFKYSPNNGVNWYTITILTGSYELSAINTFIKRTMQANGHWDKTNNEYLVKILADYATLKSVLYISKNYKVDFNIANSIRSILGFDAGVYSEGYHESQRIVNIMSVNSILVNNSCVGGAYVNGSQQPTIFSFFPNSSPGYKIVEWPTNLVYLPITLNTITIMETWITDQDGKELDLRGEVITIRFK